MLLTQSATSRQIDHMQAGTLKNEIDIKFMSHCESAVPQRGSTVAIRLHLPHDPHRLKAQRAGIESHRA